MTTKITFIRRFWPLFALGAASLGTLSLAHAFADRFDWPSWIQAVGSFVAILVAVWVSSDQGKQQQAREAERERHEVAGVLRSITAELATVFSYFQSEVGTKLDTEPGKPIRVTFPIAESPFQIFDGLIPKLGLIPDTRLQAEIIHVYALAKGLVMTARKHNDLVEDLEIAEAIPTGSNPLVAIKAKGKALTSLLDYDIALRDSAERTRIALVALLDKLVIICAD